MNNIHHIVYINLTHRTDRRAEVEGELTRMGLSGERFDAIKEDPGIVGCGKSHLAVLELAKERGWEHVLILEDDFQFVVEKDTLNSRIQAFFDLQIPYDVLMISHILYSSERFNDVVCRATEVQTAAGYLVHSRFYDALIANMKEAIPLLISTGRVSEYANDQYWKRLQRTAQWFCTNQRLGIQRPSFSDNWQIFTDYRNC